MGGALPRAEDSPALPVYRNRIANTAARWESRVVPYPWVRSPRMCDRFLQPRFIHHHPMRLKRAHLHELRFLRIRDEVAVTVRFLSLVRELVDLLLR